MDDVQVWCMSSACEVMRVACGGWKRAHTFMQGPLPSAQHCFVYTKNGALHVHATWQALDSPSHHPPTSLHMRHHGGEIHNTLLVLQR